MVKRRVDKVVDDDDIKEEVEKVTKDKKVVKKKTINKKTKTEKKNSKKEKEQNKTSKNKRKLKKSNILVMIICIIFIVAGIIGILYGVGVLTFSLKDPGPNYYNLSEKVNVGDYVDYNADFWEEEKGVPTRDVPFTFGGYQVSTSRNNSVSCNYKSIENKGWRVFSIDDDVVTLIHAGVPMCYYHGYGAGTNDMSVNILSNLDENIKLDYFLDGKFGESVRILSKEDIDKITESDSSYTRINNSLIKVGIPYWLASKNGSYYMWYVTEGGTIAVNHVGSYGVRVLVTLKKNVKTTGTDKEGNWMLAEETKKEE